MAALSAALGEPLFIDTIAIYNKKGCLVVNSNGEVNTEATEKEKEAGTELYDIAQLAWYFIWKKMRKWEILPQGKHTPFYAKLRICCPERSKRSFVQGTGEKFAFTHGKMPPEIVAHELMHQVVKWLNPLGNEGESGAINESIADVAGIVFKCSKRSKRIFSESEHAEDPWRLGGYRHLNKVTIYELFRDVESGDTPNRDNDYGYVHHNCKILNSGFYLAARLLTHDERLRIWLTAFSQLKEGEKTMQGFAKKTIEVANAIGKSNYKKYMICVWEAVYGKAV